MSSLVPLDLKKLEGWGKWYEAAKVDKVDKVELTTQL